MKRPDGVRTDPALLGRLRDGRDQPAWREFFGRYDRMMRHWARDYGLDDESVDELCDRSWNRLWPRMQTFQYDPGLRFRSWLRRFLHSRAMDMLNERGGTANVSLDALTQQESSTPNALPGDGDSDVDEEPSRVVLIREGQEAQEAVRSRVDPATWRAFWLTKVDGRPPAEVAALLGKSYAAVYYGSRRVEGMLREEGERRLARLLNARGCPGHRD
jgi:RNA polymerase sigma factor (sigma-70 family)